MKVFVYVEGRSDSLGLETILSRLLDEARTIGVRVRFLPLRGKERVLRKAPSRAVVGLTTDPSSWHIALPDLYPMKQYDNTDFSHGSCGELRDLLTRQFREAAADKGLPSDAAERFRVHCLKYDLEVLLLAARKQLAERLGTEDRLRSAWRLPVEDQNDDKPPKKVVNGLFRKYKKRAYSQILDAKPILEKADLNEVARACRQNFKPFVEDLRRIISQAN